MPIADVLLPNIFELARLTGRSVKDGAAALEAAQALQRSSGVKVLVATGVPAERPDRIAALALAGGKVHRAEAPRAQAARVGHRRHLLSACSPAATCATATPRGALDFAMRAMDVICTATEKADADELHDRADPERVGE